MASLAHPYTPDRKIKVREATIRRLRKLGMTKALAEANSGRASSEQLEAARRFYGNRVKVPGTVAPAIGKTSKGAPVGAVKLNRPAINSVDSPKGPNVTALQKAAQKRAMEDRLKAQYRAGGLTGSKVYGPGPGLKTVGDKRGFDEWTVKDWEAWKKKNK